MLRLAKKAFLKIIGMNPLVDRLVRYRDPKRYWGDRGGDQYFQEQEAVQARTLRSQFITTELKKYPFQTLLEIGCGYGKQLKNLYGSGKTIVGCDFSRPQLLKAREYCAGLDLKLIEADGSQIPLKSKSFDLVFSSAVILHNDYKKAQRMIAEMIRLSRKFIAHNEDTDVTFSRYGYDMKKTYEKLGFKIHQSCQIPCANQPEITQFTVIEIPDPKLILKADDIPLQYH
ncbi:MAG: class I SAM-dependent methyltransferase [Candidatus Omnitrophica bacterium]|nr:class I SAM-dependent methyltransferase [Candidatus Omnitrophota bacterium]